MAARKNLKHDDRTREKIRTSQLVNRLQSFALGQDGANLDKNQIKAIETLLKKTLPDLSTVALTGEGGGPVKGHLVVSFK